MLMDGRCRCEATVSLLSILLQKVQQAVRWMPRDSNDVAPHGTHTNRYTDVIGCVEVGSQLSVHPTIIDDLIGGCGKVWAGVF